MGAFHPTSVFGHGVTDVSYDSSMSTRSRNQSGGLDRRIHMTKSLWIIAVPVGLLFNACGPLASDGAQRSPSTVGIPEPTSVTAEARVPLSLAVSTSIGSATIDGVLDCGVNQVLRDGEVNVSAATEEAVVSLALDPLMTSMSDRQSVGGMWSVVEEGREIALALAEKNGDGSWVIHDVRVCGEPRSSAAPVDGELDCASDTTWGQQGTPDPSIPGATTAEAAVTSALETYRARFGGEIRFHPPTTGTLIVDAREQIIVRISEVPAGGWGGSNVEGCEGFGP